MIRFLTSTVLSSLVLSQEVKLIDESFNDTPPELLSAAKLLTSLRTDPDEIPTPVILWHGMGDHYNSYFSMGSMKRLIEQEIPGVYVRSLCIGNDHDDVSKCSGVTDTINGFLGDSNKMIDHACKIVTSDPQLALGFHAVGFSQGGLFSRVLAQRCPVPVKSLISIGGPQNGVGAFPSCDPNGPNGNMCTTLEELLDFGAYVPVIQNHLIQAQYWHDAMHPDKYKSKNIFLADVNQENYVNETEVMKLGMVQDLVLVRFNQDSVITPIDSEWFGFYQDGQDVIVEAAQELPIWTNLGLQNLYSEGKLTFLATDGDHLQFTTSWFVEEIIPFLEQ